MKRENILYSVIGVLLGFIVGFAFANASNRQGYTAAQAGVAGQPQQVQGLPPDHPPIDGAYAGPDAETLAAAAKLASDRPDNFDAQVQAAQLSYAAHRYEEAIKLFTRADSLRPGDGDVLAGLGNTNFDAGRFEEAGRWYEAALRQRPDDVDLRTDLGLTFFFREPRDIERAIKEFRSSLSRDPRHVQTLQNLTVALITKGDAEAARATLAKLEEVTPQNPSLPRLRADLEKLGTPGEESAAATNKK